MFKPLAIKSQDFRSHFVIFLMIPFVIACIAGCDRSFMKSAENLKSEARQAIEAKNFSDAASIAQKLTEKAPNDYEGYFILAQAKAQVGDKNAALIALEQAIKKGLKDDPQIERNVNLDPLKSMTAYSDLINTSFPSHKAAQDKTAASAVEASSYSSASVSIHETDGKQVVRAGDVVVEVPTAK